MGSEQGAPGQGREPEVRTQTAILESVSVCDDLATDRNFLIGGHPELHPWEVVGRRLCPHSPEGTKKQVQELCEGLYSLCGCYC